jgi:ferrochelatase
MDIENLVNIIGGELINSPKVTKIEAATIYPSKVEIGDAFFCTNLNDLPKAIQNGAYAIIFEGDLNISDDEIAYIKVDSIKDAGIKFLRYIILQKNSKIYYMPKIATSYLKQIINKKTHLFTLLSNDFKKSFETLLNDDKEILITTNLDFAKDLTPNFVIYNNEAKGYIINDSLLKTTFKLEKFVYQNMPIPPFFLKYLKNAVSFAKKFQLNYDINKIRYFKEFLPYYIDKNLNVVTKGSSEKAIIFTETLEVVEESINYLKNQSRWSKSIVLTPPKTKLLSISKPIWIDDYKEARKILKNQHFNFAFCYKINSEEILNNQIMQQKTLF